LEGATGFINSGKKHKIEENTKTLTRFKVD